MGTNFGLFDGESWKLTALSMSATLRLSISVTAASNASQLLKKTSHIKNFFHLPTALLSIDVQNFCKIINLMKDHGLDGFPHLSFSE